MPGSEKILKNRERAANRAAGIGDKDGKLSSNIKKAEVMIRCTQCQTEIRATKRNVEAGAHATSRHPQVTFQVCFPGAALPEGHAGAGGGEKERADRPKVDIDRVRAEAAEARSIAEGGTSKADKKKKKKKDDLSDLMAAMNTGKK